MLFIWKQHVLQMNEMPGVQCIDRLPSVMLYQDVGGSFDATEMPRVMLCGGKEQGKRAGTCDVCRSNF